MRRMARAAVGALTVALALTACTSRKDDKPSAPSSAPTDLATTMSAVAEKVTQAGSGKVQFTMKNDKATLYTGKGAFAFGTDRGDTSDVSMTAQDKTTTRVLSIGATRYVQLPDKLRAEQHQSKPWSKIAPGGNGLLDGLSDGAAASGDSADPRNTLALLKTAGRVTATAKEDLGDKSTTHYTIEVDTKEALGERTKFLPAEQKKRFTEVLSKLPPTTTTQLWITDDNLPLRVISESANSPLGKTTTQADYQDWGAQVRLAPPAAQQVEEQPLPSAPPSK